MADEVSLMSQLHELLSYLRQMGASTLLVLGQHGLAGPTHTPVDVSYLADTVVLLRYFEARGEVRQAISVMKKRAGPHERSIRELRLSSSGVAVGEPLHDFEGVLSGFPAARGAGKTSRKAVDVPHD